jgi:hypothetical protein
MGSPRLEHDALAGHQARMRSHLKGAYTGGSARGYPASSVSLIAQIMAQHDPRELNLYAASPRDERPHLPLGGRLTR